MIEPSSKERKILDCPHCGAKASNLSLSKLKGVTVYREEGVTGVVCLECGSSSTSVDTWNMRVEKTRETANIRITVAANGAPTPYSVPPGSTAASLAGNRTFKDDLGLGNNIRILVNGTVTDRRIVDGDVLIVQTLASQTFAKRVDERPRQTITGKLSDIEYIVHLLKKTEGKMGLGNLSVRTQRRINKTELCEILENSPKLFTLLPAPTKNGRGTVVVLNSTEGTTSETPKKEEVVYIAQPPPKSVTERPTGAILWQKGVISEKGDPVMETFPRNPRLKNKHRMIGIIKSAGWDYQKATRKTGMTPAYIATLMLVSRNYTANKPTTVVAVCEMFAQAGVVFTPGYARIICGNLVEQGWIVVSSTEGGIQGNANMYKPTDKLLGFSY